jgi:hypothetical protein
MFLKVPLNNIEENVSCSDLNRGLSEAFQVITVKYFLQQLIIPQ